jgi:1-acyl-sn-glycerol-3-phosphate acyltransferase
MKKIILFIYSLYALLVFILLMLIAFPFIAIVSFFGTYGGNAVYKIAKIWGEIWYFCICIKHKNYFESVPDKNKQYIFVANHSSYMDIPALVRCMQQPYRVLGKYEMVKIPIFGFIYKCAVILVERSSAEKRAKSFHDLKQALAKGLSIFIFPEGTFNETDKPLKNFYDGAFRIAIETKTPILPIIFLDTIHRLPPSHLFRLTPGISRAVFLKPIEVNDYTSTSEIDILKSIVYNEMEKALIKYRTKAIKLSTYNN